MYTAYKYSVSFIHCVSLYLRVLALCYSLVLPVDGATCLFTQREDVLVSNSL